jgi:hypothetical protein
LTNLAIAHLRRNNEWVAPFNPWIAAATGSNMDLSFLSTRAKALALMYYITNYSTKDENSTYQMVTVVAVIKESQERVKATTKANDEERDAGEITRRMSLDKEVSSMQVASSLLQLPTYYDPRSESRHINLHYLRRRFESLICRSNGDYAINEEDIAITSAMRAQTSVFDDYRCRGAMLRPLCINQYVKLVRKRPVENQTGGRILIHVTLSMGKRPKSCVIGIRQS